MSVRALAEEIVALEKHGPPGKYIRVVVDAAPVVAQKYLDALDAIRRALKHGMAEEADNILQAVLTAAEGVTP